jgi:hypothetical protein
VPSFKPYDAAAQPLRLALLGLLGLGTLAPMPTEALEASASARLTTDYTTNTLQTQDDPIGEWVNQPGVDVRALHESADVQLDADYSYIRRIYQKDFWVDENRTVGRGSLNWEPLERRLSFFAQNTRTETTGRARGNLVQDNRQVVSTSSMGSTLNFRPRTKDDLQFEYTFIDIAANRFAGGNSVRQNGTARYILALSPSRQLVLSGTYSDIEYEGPFPEAEYSIATVTYRQQSDTLDLSLSVGENRFDRTGRGTTSDPTYDANLTWRAAAATTLTLRGSQRITDQANALTGQGAGAGFQNTDVNAAFEETIGELGLAQALGARTNLSLRVFWLEQIYAEDVPLSNDRLGLSIGFDRRLTPTTTFRASANWARRNFEQDDDEQDELNAFIDLQHRIGRTLTLNLGARYLERQATSSFSFEEWIGSVGFAWQFWRRGP